MMLFVWDLSSLSGHNAICLGSVLTDYNTVCRPNLGFSTSCPACLEQISIESTFTLAQGRVNVCVCPVLRNFSLLLFYQLIS